MWKPGRSGTYHLHAHDTIARLDKTVDRVVRADPATRAPSQAAFGHLKVQDRYRIGAGWCRMEIIRWITG